jgi:hypothetical protein
MDTPETAATIEPSETTQTENPCRPAYEWTKDFRIVRTCR